MCPLRSEPQTVKDELHPVRSNRATHSQLSAGNVDSQVTMPEGVQLKDQQASSRETRYPSSCESSWQGLSTKTQTCIPVSPITSNTTYKVGATIHGSLVSFTLDTGAAVTLICKDVWDSVKSTDHRLEMWNGQNLIGVEGTPLQVHGYTKTTIQLAGEQFHVRVIVVDSLTTEAILGMDFLEANDCTIDIGKKQLLFPKLKLSIPLKDGAVAHIGVTLTTSLHIPAMSEIEVTAKINGVSNTGTWLLKEKDSRKLPVRVARALVCPNSNNVPVHLLNVESTSVTVYKNTQIATMERIEEGIDEDMINISTIESHNLTEEKKQMLWSIVEQC